MSIIEKIAEQKIKEAQKNGEFDNLPKAGKPLNLEADCFTPEEERVATRILKNSGYVPPIVDMQNEIDNLKQRILKLTQDQNLEREKLTRELRIKEVSKALYLKR